METRITTKTSIKSRAGGKEHLNSPRHLILSSLSFNLFLLSCAQILQGQIPSLYHFMFVSFFLSPTHSFLPWMASMAVVLIVSSSPSSGSLFPHFIHPFAHLSLLSPSIEELGQGTAKIPVLFALFLYFTSPNFSLTPTNTLTHNIQHTIMSSLRRCMQNSGCFAFSTQPSRRHKEHKRGLTSYYKDKLTYKNTHKHPQ